MRAWRTEWLPTNEQLLAQLQTADDGQGMREVELCLRQQQHMEAIPSALDVTALPQLTPPVQHAPTLDLQL